MTLWFAFSPPFFFLYLFALELYCSVVWFPLGRASISASYVFFFATSTFDCSHNFRQWRSSQHQHYWHYFLNNHRISTAKNGVVCSSWSAAQGDFPPSLQSLILQTLLTRKGELCINYSYYPNIFVSNSVRSSNSSKSSWTSNFWQIASTFCDSMVTQISASASSLLSCLMFIFFSSFAINPHGEHLFCAELILQWWHWQQDDNNNDNKNTMVLAMGFAVNIIKGGQLHTTIKWWGCVCGEHFFCAEVQLQWWRWRQDDNNNNDGNTWCWQWGLLLME